MSQEIELLDPEPATLTVEARAAIALKSSDTELHLIAMAAKNAGIVAILDKPGREQAHGAAMELKRTRVQAVADTFGVSLNTTADWLTNAADEIANFE